jgi:hypothetical protein
LNCRDQTGGLKRTCLAHAPHAHRRTGRSPLRTSTSRTPRTARTPHRLPPAVAQRLSHGLVFVFV